jgi:hypothetical protein
MESKYYYIRKNYFLKKVISKKAIQIEVQKACHRSESLDFILIGVAERISSISCPQEFANNTNNKSATLKVVVFYVAINRVIGIIMLDWK